MDFNIRDCLFEWLLCKIKLVSYVHNVSEVFQGVEELASNLADCLLCVQNGFLTTYLHSNGRSGCNCNYS